MKCKFLLALILVVIASPSVFAYCNVSLEITHEVSDGKVFFSHEISPKTSSFIIEYWIEDINGNIIKPRLNTTNLNKKSFTPAKSAKDIIIKSRMLGLGCENSANSQGYAEKNVNIENDSYLGISFKVKSSGTSSNPSPSFERNEKMKGVIPFFIIFILALISIVLIWRR